MDIMKIYGNEYGALEKSLKYQSVRHSAHASNIANISTPLYQAKEFNFEKSLKEEFVKEGGAGFLTKTHAGHLSMHSPAKLTLDKTNLGRIDGNNVDLDKEMVAISNNEIDNETTLALFRKKMGLLKYTISASEGGY